MIASYTALHYGTDYLYWALRSIRDDVDQHVILYCPHGSHGAKTDRVCPDSRAELQKQAQLAIGKKLLWIDGDWSYEHEQRESIYQYVPDADVILIVDADEIWGTGLAKRMIEAYRMNIRTIRAPVLEFWRSFHYAEQTNLVFPERAIYPHGMHGEPGYLPLDNNRPRICHMGYAKRSEIVEYKQHTHGHKGDWREGWYEEKFLKNDRYDCHPTNVAFWHPTPVNPLDYMPSFMAEHPYFNLEVIP